MSTEQRPIDSGFSETATASEVIAGRDLIGKVVVITGGHSGIGLETTSVLASVGASIVIGARDVTKAREAVSPIKHVQVFELDLAEPASVDEFAKRYRQSFHQCDILINNAGIMATPLLRNSQGYELQLATNHLGHFRLTAGLWTELSQSKAVRALPCPAELKRVNLQFLTGRNAVVTVACAIPCCEGLHT